LEIKTDFPGEEITSGGPEAKAWNGQLASPTIRIRRISFIYPLNPVRFENPLKLFDEFQPISTRSRGGADDTHLFGPGIRKLPAKMHHALHL
jgi:hypothetical protein